MKTKLVRLFTILFFCTILVSCSAKGKIGIQAPSSIVLEPGDSITIYAATLVPTQIPVLTPTSTNTSTATPTPTNTSAPPTSTDTPTPTPTLTATTPATSTPPTPGTITNTVNMPYQCLSSNPLFMPAVAWFGSVSPSDNYSDIRIYCVDDSSIKIVVHVIDRLLYYDTTPSLSDLTQWDSVSLILNDTYEFDGQLSWFEGRNGYQASYVDGVLVNLPFTTATEWRGEAPNTNVDDKGWNIAFTIPYSSLSLSSKPAEGTIYKLRVITHDRDDLAGPAVDTSWTGNVRFGMPVFTPPSVSSNGIVTVRHNLNGAVVQDAEVGGHTICGDDMISDYWNLWGNRNYAGGEQVNIQNQWDIADWPCFSKFYITFPLPSLLHQQIISATYQMFMFGSSGGGIWGTPPDTYIQAFIINKDWSESTITWNNAPQAVENVAGTWVYPMTDQFWVLYKWDLSRAVSEAYAKGETSLRLAFYEGDGERHTGKYFISSDTSEFNADTRPSLLINYGGSPITPTSTASSTSTPTPTSTATPTSTTTPSPTFTDTPTATSTQRPTVTPTPTQRPTVVPTSSTGMTYYISPTGNDASSGTSETNAWATFNHAWPYLYPGDTLIMLDGIYYQALHPNIRNGQPGKYITIKAKNDGKAVIDGQYQRLPVELGNAWPGPIGDYFIIDGIIAKNSSWSVYTIAGFNNILRRVSGYNAETDQNAHVFEVTGNYNLIEDAIASGTGRKMAFTYFGQYNVFRRVFAAWQQWDGRTGLACWPWGDGIEIYNADNNIIENSITYGKNPVWAMSLVSQGNGSHAIGNKFLGDMAILAGMIDEKTPMTWPSTRPGPTTETCVRDFNQGGVEAGFNVYEGYAEIRDTLWQDIFAWGNSSFGINWDTELGVYRGSGGHPNTGNNNIVRATLFNNGLNQIDGPYPGQFGGKNVDALQISLTRFNSIIDSRIDKIFINWPSYPDPSGKNLTYMTGEGARLKYQYVNGTMGNVPLWPWPMEGRGMSELGISITDMLTSKIFGTTDLTKIYP